MTVKTLVIIISLGLIVFSLIGLYMTYTSTDRNQAVCHKIMPDWAKQINATVNSYGKNTPILAWYTYTCTYCTPNLSYKEEGYYCREYYQIDNNRLGKEIK